MHTIQIEQNSEGYTLTLDGWGVGVTFPDYETAKRVAGVLQSASVLNTYLTPALRTYQMMQAVLDGHAQVEALDDRQIIIYTNLQEEGRDARGFPVNLVPFYDEG